MNPTEYAIIVAGGKGTRIKSSLPKQFLELNGIPIIIHTLNAFVRYSRQIKIILVLPEDDMDTWADLSNKHQFTTPIVLQTGGDTRFQSVKRGLQKIDGDGLVAIHDGVRPLISEDIIGASFRLAAVHRSAVAAVRLKESIRMTDPRSAVAGSAKATQDNTRAVDRSRFRLIQTPQTFDVALIRKAYEATEDPSLTDDASVAEKAGHVISLFEGSYENIKITTPEDLIVASALLSARK
ncbi:MAG TPA: 2-C-methyl-D-erythritol 4-phosphate cytidylyltransferase [Cyclobacteriaceae bacterium]|nr:2-C-methyl-D-erythritol 4-phosphate cytidylyltransferase [Cyclobacteriaceae bacterium]